MDLTLLGYFSPLQINSTPLHVACENRHYDIVAVLLSYNADGTKKDHVRSTHTHAHAHTTQHTHTHTHMHTHFYCDVSPRAMQRMEDSGFEEGQMADTHVFQVTWVITQPCF